MKTSELDRQLVNNDLYDDLGSRWYEAWDDPVALLRQESRVKLQWAKTLLNPGQKILDIGCGAGLIANPLSRDGHEVTGLDQSEQSLNVARRYDQTKQVNYIRGDAYELPFQPHSFEVVIAFDFLEHVSKPLAVIQEVSRVLKPGGLFLFHTFNRNPVSWVFALKGIEWFVKNTPKNLHSYHLFIKPHELETYLEQANLNLFNWQGIRPKSLGAIARIIKSGVVPTDFEFVFTDSKLVSYCGAARKTHRVN